MNEINIISINDIERQCKDKWFYPDAMKAFKTKLSPYGYQGPDSNGPIFFVSSEKESDKVRRYTVRALVNGFVKRVSEFQGYATSHKANKAAESFAKNNLTI